ncbi:sugar ABC transporter permease [Heyndrickxia shackletonii]|uniref:Sugar ABC transporter permease n=1 Tax=Heyndrickxia shackletonii TaxID=157838 RepID=A0A0Q3WZF4_9BACI|nr:ABC transporter permease [Heyndrickxia shackletonii]KQL54572.1 sugar ABC transporter permease [Heyndrickxia shackletonii]NEY98214.1 ABC transporter permease [Heyndrickxia shackletonii]
MSIMTALEIIITSSLLMAAPLIFTSLGGVFSERSGVINIGLEGLMIMGAFSSIIFNLSFAHTFGAATPWLGLLVAMIVGGIFALIHGIAAISFRADQTVSGVAINFLALGLSVFLVKMLYQGKGQTDTITQNFNKIDIPVLNHIPVIGKLFFRDVTYPSYLAIIIAIIAWYVIYKTPFGLRLRSVGEHPMAADTMGINVIKMRYIAVFLSGVFGGLGGAVYSQTITLDFSATTIAGQGFMALAAMIFGKWHPLGAMGAALFFGFAQSLSIVGDQIPFLKDIPSVYLLIAPYVLTILALAGFVGRAEAPKADGIPYIKGQR